MLEIHPAKEISGELTLPPDPDLYVLSNAIAVALGRGARIAPMGAAPIWHYWEEQLQSIVSVTAENGFGIIQPRTDDGSSFVRLPYGLLPFRELIVFALLGAGKTVALAGASQNRIDYWQSLARTFGCTPTQSEFDGDPALALPSESALRIPDTFIEANSIHALLGLAMGMRSPVSAQIDYLFSSPLRSVLPCFGIELSVKSNQALKESDPLARRIRMMQARKKTEIKQTFTLTADFSASGCEAKIHLPGDALLSAVAFAAKSLVQKGNLIVANTPLETWNNAFLNYVRKMGCRFGVQETGETSFGTAGMVQLQRFSLVGRKMQCTPRYQYLSQLPVMVVLSTFAAGQSVFRNLEDLRRDSPDPIEEILACVRLIGGRHGEMPDGMVIDGAKQFDGFDCVEELPAALSGACAVSGLRCTGKTTVADKAITQRWGDFKALLDTVCEYRTSTN